MSDPFIGELRLFPYNFAPRGWAFCSGQLMSISQNTALFALLGTTYGGNGQTTFGLPDLRGRAAVSSGQGPGLSPYDLGQLGGTEFTSLLQTSMPAHSHSVGATMVSAGDNKPMANYLAVGGSYVATAPNTTMGPLMIGSAGGGQPFPLLDPYLALNYCIALSGIFPARN